MVGIAAYVWGMAYHMSTTGTTATVRRQRPNEENRRSTNGQAANKRRPAGIGCGGRRQVGRWQNARQRRMAVAVEWVINWQGQLSPELVREPSSAGQQRQLLGGRSTLAKVQW